MSANPKIMSDTDYDNLLHIVEAEAGTEDIKGRVLIANVIMNRLSHEEFPDTITGVILDQRNGIPQFSPVYDGKFYEVTVTDETREAVKQALEGTDYSEGALFFVQRSAADKKNVSWFDKDLKNYLNMVFTSFTPTRMKLSHRTLRMKPQKMTQMLFRW